MNNYYTLIYLTEYLKNKLGSFYYQFSISPHKNVWEGYFADKDEKQYRLIFSTTPGEIALFLDKFRPPKKGNVLYFFEDLKNRQIKNITLAEGDRFLFITFGNDQRFQFQLFGSNANLYLNDNKITVDAFKDTDSVTGEQPPEPRKPKKPEEKGTDHIQSARQWILHYDLKFPRQLIKPVINHYDLDSAGPDKIQSVVTELITSIRENPEFRVLKDGSICLVPNDLLPLENEKTFEGINDAVRFAYYKASHLRRFSQKMNSVRPAIEKELDRSRRTLEQLEQADKALERAEEYEQFGHILMAHAHEQLDAGQESIELNNFYRDNERQKIDVKPELSIAENAQHYYEKSTKAKRRVTESKRREKETRLKIKKLEKILNSLDSVNNLYELQDWEKDYSNLLDELGLTSGKKQKTSSPFRKTEISGYEIWIGRNAKSNDQLTSLAHKEDIWLHAREVPGSHVVIRMNNNPEFPPNHVILHAAAYAAWFSKLRGSKLVPVIITKKKYVTKPKGAPPGTVRVQREKVEMVPPKKPD